MILVLNKINNRQKPLCKYKMGAAILSDVASDTFSKE